MIKKSVTFIGTFAFAAFMIFSISPAFGQKGDPDAVKILEKMQEAFEKSIEGIDDFVMVKDQYTVYNKKAWENGRPYFKTRTEMEHIDGIESTSTASESNIYSQDVYSSLLKNAVYEGTKELNGHEVHVLFVNELEGFIEDPDVEETIEDFWLYIDSNDWVVRKMKFVMEFITDDGEIKEIEPLIRNSDFRNVEGMIIPYKTTTIISGLALSDEERKEAYEQLEEMEEELAQMTPEERRMVEQMMGDQLEQYKRMLDEDEIEIVSRVKEIKVNTGMDDF